MSSSVENNLHSDFPQTVVMKKYQLQENTSSEISFKIDYAKELNAEQLEVVLHGNGPCLVLAGAGSGKTRTLVYRVAYLLEHGVSPERILLMTFTNKAAFEMMHRVELLLKARPKGLWGGTFHSLANRILRKYAEKIGYTNNFNILDAEDSKSFLKSCVGELLELTREKYFPKPDVIASIISFAKNSRQDIAKVCWKKYDFDTRVVQAIASIVEIYERRKKAGNMMDFDDLLVNWHTLLVECPDVLEKLSDQFKYILVDEYQDTNKIQSSIVDKLASKHKDVLVVGDDAQRHHFSRNDIEHSEISDQYEGAKVFHLQTNYRSSPEIYSLRIRVLPRIEISMRSRSGVQNKAQKPVLIAARDSYQQAEFVCQRLLELRNEGRALWRWPFCFVLHFR